MKKLFLLLLSLPFIAAAQQPEKLIAISHQLYSAGTGTYKTDDSTAYIFTTGGGGDPWVARPHLYDSVIFIKHPVDSPKVALGEYQVYNDSEITTVRGSLRYQAKYDSRGNIVESISSQWQNNQWVFFSKVMWAFDANNNEVLRQTEVYDNAAASWKNYDRVIYYYTGKALDSVRSQSYTTEWRDTGKLMCYHIDPSYSIELYLSKRGNQWDSSYRYHRYYNANRQMLLDSAETYNTVFPMVWYVTGTRYYRYDANGNLVLDSGRANLKLPPNIPELRSHFKAEYTYNSFGQRTSWLVYEPGGSDQMDLIGRRLYYYGSHANGIPVQPSKLQLLLYPNPAGNTLMVSGETGGSYLIYSTDGRLVSNGIHTGVINIGALSTGSYFIVFGNGNTARFEKQ